MKLLTKSCMAALTLALGVCTAAHAQTAAPPTSGHSVVITNGTPPTITYSAPTASFISFSSGMVGPQATIATRPYAVSYQPYASIPLAAYANSFSSTTAPAGNLNYYTPDPFQGAVGGASQAIGFGSSYGSSYGSYQMPLVLNGFSTAAAAYPPPAIQVAPRSYTNRLNMDFGSFQSTNLYADTIYTWPR